MNPNMAIRVTNLHKTFPPSIKLGKPDRRSLDAAVTAVFGRRIGLLRRRKVFATDHTRRALFEEFQFDVKPGQVIGITGQSGAGKTVLLKLIAGSSPPSSGRIEISGTLVALLDLAESLELEKTILENVEAFVDLHNLDSAANALFYEKVVEFGGLKKFQHIPIRHFSTGMMMRLGVAMVMMCNSDIVLIDDILDVGDIAFKAKCVEQLQEMKRKGRTVLLITQDELLLDQIADRIVHLHRGQVVADRARTPGGGDYSWNPTDVAFDWHLSSYDAENEFVRVTGVSPVDGYKDDSRILDLEISFKLLLKQTVRPLIDVRKEGVLIFRSLYPENIEFTPNGTGDLIVSVEIPVWLMTPGVYVVDLGFLSLEGENSHGLKTRGMLTLQVGAEGQNMDEAEGPGAVSPAFEWAVQNLDESPG